MISLKKRRDFGLTLAPICAERWKIASVALMTIRTCEARSAKRSRRWSEGRLNIDLLQKKQAEKELQSAEEVVPRAARECYKWLLCPVQNSATDPKPTVEAFPLNSSGGSAGNEIERVCIDNELVITTWSPIHLRTKLKELYWKDGKTTVGAMNFWDDTLKYLYLPRLKNRDSLSQAIRTGALSTDFFGTAYGLDGDKYAGFHVGEGNVQFDDTLLLIEPSAANDYALSLKRAKDKKEAEDAAKLSGSDSTGGSSSGGMTTGGAAGTGSTSSAHGTGTAGGSGTAGNGSAQLAKSKSFHGSIQIKPNCAKVHLVSISEWMITSRQVALNPPTNPAIYAKPCVVRCLIVHHFRKSGDEFPGRVLWRCLHILLNGNELTLKGHYIVHHSPEVEAAC